MIAVVTGSSGFIGSHVIDALLAQNATVRALVRPQSPRASRNTNVEYSEVDFLNTDAVRTLPVWNDVTHVFHLAGATTASSRAAFRNANVRPLKNILAALKERKSTLARVVIVSSLAAAGPAKSATQPVTEDDQPRPVEWYGESKLEAEIIAAEYTPELPITVVRPPSVYGPRDKDFLAAFRQASGKVALHAIPPDHLTDIVHVSDVVSALLLAATHPAAIARTYFLASDAPISWRALYAEVARNAGSRPTELVVPQWLMRAGAIAGDVIGTVTKSTPLLNSQKLCLAKAAYWLCSSARIRRELGWQPVISHEQGIRDTFRWYVSAGWLQARRAAGTNTLHEEPKA